MNDNYFPNDQIVLTEKEKQQFLQTLPSLVSIDEGIKRAVQIVNDMPYFLTQSSCEGHNPNQPMNPRNQQHMPIPFLSIGVIYNAFGLLEELADFLWHELKGHIRSLSFDGHVQAINVHEPTDTNVPNFQRYLNVFLKNKQSISLLEEALIKFSKRPLPSIDTNVDKLEQELVDKYENYLIIANSVAQTFKNAPSVQLMDDLVNKLRNIPEFSTVTFREEPPRMGFPKAYTLTFYSKNKQYSIPALFDMLCSFFSGDLIVGDEFQATPSGTPLREVSLALFAPDRANLFCMMAEHWAEIGGRWENSPYWRK